MGTHVLQSTLAAQTELLQGYMTHVRSFMERAEATLSRLSLVPAMFKTIPTSCLHGEVDVCIGEVS